MKRIYLIGLIVLFCSASIKVNADINEDYGATNVYTPYEAPKVLFEFYFDHPQKLSSALYWLQNLYNTLESAPYDMPPDDIQTIVVMHGTEISALAKKNYPFYQRAIQRMRYYADLGVQFKVCRISATQYGYSAEDFPDFIEIVPSAITEIIYWQNNGYAMVVPHIMERTFSLDESR